MHIHPAILVLMLVCGLLGLGGLCISTRWMRDLLWLFSIPPLCLGVLALLKGWIAKDIDLGFLMLLCVGLFWPVVACWVGEFVTHWRLPEILPSDLYISTDDEAARYDIVPQQFKERAQHKGISTLELSTLWTILRKGRRVEENEFPCLLHRQAGKRFVHRLPEEMVADLSKLNAEQTAALASRWVATEAWGWTEEEARSVVADLVRLSRIATDNGRNVYLWTSEQPNEAVGGKKK